MRNSPITLIIVGILLILISGSLGYWVGSNNSSSSTNSVTTISSPNGKPTIPVDPFLQNQGAAVTAYATKVVKGTVTLVNTNGQQEDFPISPKFIYYSINGTSPVANTNPSSIPNNILLTVNLTLTSQGYEVSSMYTAPPKITPPSLNKSAVSTPSAKPASK